MGPVYSLPKAPPRVWHCHWHCHWPGRGSLNDRADACTEQMQFRERFKRLLFLWHSTFLALSRFLLLMNFPRRGLAQIRDEPSLGYYFLAGEGKGQTTASASICWSTLALDLHSIYFAYFKKGSIWCSQSIRRIPSLSISEPSCSARYIFTKYTDGGGCCPGHGSDYKSERKPKTPCPCVSYTELS